MAIDWNPFLIAPKEEVLSKAVYCRLLSDGIPVTQVLCSLDPLNPFRKEYRLKVEFMGVEGQPKRFADAVFDLWLYERTPETATKNLINDIESQYPKVLNPIPFTQ